MQQMGRLRALQLLEGTVCFIFEQKTQTYFNRY